MSGSILDAVRERQASLEAEQYTDLEIPTWGANGHPRAWLRVKPVPGEFIEAQQGLARRARGGALAAAVLKANASIIVKATEAVLIGEGEEQGSFRLDDPDLLAALGVPEAASGAQALMALVGNDRTGADGYVIALSEAVARHSGYAAEIVQEQLLGE